MASLRQHKKHKEEERHPQGSTWGVVSHQQQPGNTYSHRHHPCQPPAASITTFTITAASTMYHRAKHRLPPLHRHSSLLHLTPHSESPLSSLISRTLSTFSRQRQRRRPLLQLHLPQFAFCCLLMGSLVPPCVAICPNDCTCDVDVRLGTSVMLLQLPLFCVFIMLH